MNGKMTTFFEKNPEMEEKVLELQRNAQSEGLSTDEFAQKCVELLKENGFELSQADMLQLIKESNELTDGEALSLDELDNVSGGGCDCSEHTCNGKVDVPICSQHCQ